MNKQITANDVVKYIAGILNIDLSNNALLLEDMIEDIKSVKDLALFRTFIKEKFNYERFRYLTGYQKFIALVNEFKKENKLELSQEMQIKALTYSEDLFKRVTEICDEVNFELQTKGKKIEDLNLFETFKINGLENHHIGVLKHIGSKETIFTMSVYGKADLMARIESIVNKKALEKQYPQLAIKNDGAKVLERLKK